MKKTILFLWRIEEKILSLQYNFYKKNTLNLSINIMQHTTPFRRLPSEAELLRMRQQEIEEKKQERERQKQEQALALSQMADDLLWLIKQEQGRYQWIGTKRDLVEMTHKVWRQDVVFDAMGRVLPFLHLLHRVCTLLGIAMPKKPTAMLDTISHRKRQDQLSMVNRYARIIKASSSRPILRFLRAA